MKRQKNVSKSEKQHTQNIIEKEIGFNTRKKNAKAKNSLIFHANNFYEQKFRRELCIASSDSYVFISERRTKRKMVYMR